MAFPYLLLGKAVKAWGLEGELKIELYADSISLAAVTHNVYLGPAASEPVLYSVEKARRVGSGWIVKLCGVETPDEAKRLVGHELLIPRSAAPSPPEGMYYHADLIGLRVLSEDGHEFGRIVEIWETGANDIYVVRGQQGEWLLPATREVVRRIDLAEEIMLIHPLEGMIEAEAV